MQKEDLRRFYDLPRTRKASVTRELSIGCIFAGIAMGLFLFFALQTWPGDPHHCAVVWDATGPTEEIRDPHLCFCEAFEFEDVKRKAPGVRQWANTWSNLVPLLTGLILALRSGVDRFEDGLERSTREATWGGHYPLIFVLIVGFMGPGSMFFHASITLWGGWVDNLSMLLFVWFLLAYGVYVRRTSHDHEGAYARFSVIFFGGVALSMVALMFTDLYISGRSMYLLWPAAVFALVELRAMLTGARRTWWFGLALLSFLGAIAIWAASTTLGEALCLGEAGTLGPRSMVQAHGIWHVLSNLTAVFLFLHFRGTDIPGDP